jgi:hypothetical protein
MDCFIVTISSRLDDFIVRVLPTLPDACAFARDVLADRAAYLAAGCRTYRRGDVAARDPESAVVSVVLVRAGAVVQVVENWNAEAAGIPAMPFCGFELATDRPTDRHDEPCPETAEIGFTADPLTALINQNDSPTVESKPRG